MPITEGMSGTTITRELGHEEREGLAGLVVTRQKIAAVKQYRTLTGASVTEARQFVQSLEAELRRTSPERFTATSRKAQAPWVGLGGTHNSIAIVRDGHRVMCRLAHPSYLLVLGATAGFGPVAMALVALTVQGRAFVRGAPVPLVAFVGLMFLASAAVFVYQLVRYHRFVIDRRTGDVTLSSRWSGAPVHVIRRDEIAGVEVSQQAYVASEVRSVTNHVLAMVLRDGSRRALALSTRRELIDDLARELRAVAGLAEARG